MKWGKAQKIKLEFQFYLRIALKFRQDIPVK
jgi:hypothetical protein